MELNELISPWKNMDAPAKTSAEIQSMLLENKHPVLKGIKKQLTIEIMGWTAFLLCYYTMFDGDAKPIWVNIALVIAVLTSLLHNLAGYRATKYLASNLPLKASLLMYLGKVKVYASVSVASRVVLMAGFMIFFFYGLNLNASKYLSISAIFLTFAVQLVFLINIWAKRMQKLKVAVAAFN